MKGTTMKKGYKYLKDKKHFTIHYISEDTSTGQLTSFYNLQSLCKHHNISISTVKKKFKREVADFDRINNCIVINGIAIYKMYIQ